MAGGEDKITLSNILSSMVIIKYKMAGGGE
jgi:hypothetical protein